MEKEQHNIDYHKLSSHEAVRLYQKPNPSIQGTLMHQFYNDDAVFQNGKLCLDDFSLKVNKTHYGTDELFERFGDYLEKLTPMDTVQLASGYFDFNNEKDRTTDILSLEVVLKNWLQYNSPEPVSLLTVETKSRNEDFLNKATPGNDEFVMVRREQMREFATDDWIEENTVTLKILDATIPNLKEEKKKGFKM